MISHEYKCIFIHIPRTGGTSIEAEIVGKNWWTVSPETKHLTASQAKKIYQTYWDDYFTFSFIRNPWDRCVSLTTYPELFYGTTNKSISLLHINNYKQLFGYPVVVEHDRRFYNIEEVRKASHVENAIYSNILDAPMDFVGRFEELHDSFEYICNSIGKKNTPLPMLNPSTHRNGPGYRQYYDEELCRAVADLYEADIKGFNYRF